MASMTIWLCSKKSQWHYYYNQEIKLNENIFICLWNVNMCLTIVRPHGQSNYTYLLTYD